MAKNRKYEKCFTETSKEEVQVRYDLEGKNEIIALPIHFDIRKNALAPYFVEAGMTLGVHYGAGGETRVLPNGQTMRGFPHKHAFTEVFYWVGTNPDDPDDLGGTVEFWVGEGEEAEGCIITKPTTILVPRNLVHLPCAHRELHKPFFQMTALDSPLHAGITVPIVPPGFKVEREAGEQIAKMQKYEKFVSERDVTEAAVFPSHKGKSHVVLQHGMQQSELAPHFMEVNLIYGSGIGWGCGDIMQYPDSQVRSLPHGHGVVETYTFIGTDKDHLDDLGGTVEFWIGKGTEAEEYLITKPTVVFIPPGTIHLPMYVREVNYPFVMAALLNTPLWAGFYTGEFPSGFKHVVEEK